MSMTDSDIAARGPRVRHARRGLVLLLVLVYMVLAGSLMLTTAASTGQLVRTGRSEHVSVLLRQLIDSGYAWADAHGALVLETPITLDAADILPPDGSGDVTIIVDRRTPGAMLIKARLQLHYRQFTRTARLPARPSAP